jgi:hypothetical protein
MTTPSRPGGPEPDASPTEPVATPPGGAWLPPAGSTAFQPATPEDAPVPTAAPVATVAPVRAETPRSSGGSRLLNLALGAAVLVAVAGIAFAVGRATTPAQAASAAANPFGNGNRGGFQGGPNGSFDPNRGPFTNGEFPGGGAFGGRGNAFGLGGGISISGTVDSVAADSITIRTASGQSITVGLDSDTTYHQQAAATSGDVQAGKTVILQLQPRNRQGGTGNGGNGNGNGGNGQALGSASDVTIAP